MEYLLNLKISDVDLANLREAGMSITLAKPVGANKPNVTWITFDPFANSQVAWEEKFGMYASNQTVYADGTKLIKTSDIQNAKDAISYKFDETATFSEFPDLNPPTQGTFKVYNKMPYDKYPKLTFGLMQGAKISGAVCEPTYLNAALVLANLNASFTPITTVYVWLQNEYKSGTIITKITSDFTVVEYSGTTLSQTLVYDPNKGIFVADTSMNEGNNVQYFSKKDF